MDDLPHRELFDEELYLRTFPDVALAVRNGQLSSGYDHWVLNGRSELAAGQRVAGSSFLLVASSVKRYRQRGQLVKRIRRRGQPGNAEGEDLVKDGPKLGLRPMYRGCLDQFSILYHAVVFGGWANEANVEIYYDDTKLDVSLTSVKRPDLVPLFGKDAEDWGFAACATLPTNEIDRTKFKVRLNQGIPSANEDIFSTAMVPADKVFTQMVDDFRAAVAQKADPSLLEIGSRARSGNIYRDWFPEKLDYVGLDVHAGPNVDVVGDAHHLSRCVNRRFDFMFSISVFEHLLMPWKVALEMNKALNDGGRALIISHGSWPLHEEPWDFFRFSRESWHGIFNVHTGFRVVDAQYQFQASIVPIYSNAPHLDNMSKFPTYLLSGCVVEKTGPPQVAWEAEASTVYDLHYSHE